jgi:ribosomal protein S18 acetylase RimI-like enzyme
MDSTIEIRPANQNDKTNLDFFLRYEFFIHQHLDWQPALNWLGQQPFYLALHEGEIIGCLAAPSEINKVAWVRLFACSSLYSRKEIWSLLFDRIISSSHGNITTIAVLGIHQWFVDLLLTQSFHLHQSIIVFEWTSQVIPPEPSIPGLEIRPAKFEELEEVVLLDGRCFAPIWQLPIRSMQNAYQQSGYATVAVYQGKIIAYQMSTETLSTAHLARLAVDPAFQGKKIGKALLWDLFTHCLESGIFKITVNTQNDNFSSRALYARMGFVQTEENYPVLLRKI